MPEALKVRVLVANKYFFRNGGSEGVMFEEREFVLRSGHQVIDFSMDDERNVESPYASHFVSRRDYRGGGALSRARAVLSMLHSPEAVRKIRILIDETRPDLVHCHNIYHQLTPSIIGAAKSRGVPVALTVHDFKPVCPVYLRLRDGRCCSDCLDSDFSHVVKNRCAEGSLGKSAWLYAEAIVQRWLGSYESVDRLICPSRFMREAMLHRFRADRVALLYNGVDVNIHPPPVAYDGGYVLYFGRLASEKGVETLLHAHALQPAAWPLIVAGTGPLAEELSARYPDARFVGHLSGHSLEEALSRASVVVLPSQCYENCPLSVLEAMAHGKPVVGSRIGGIPELIADGETGLLFEAGDAVQLRERLDALMGSPQHRRLMGRRARERVEREFSLEQHNAGLMEIYASMVPGSQ